MKMVITQVCTHTDTHGHRPSCTACLRHSRGSQCSSAWSAPPSPSSSSEPRTPTLQVSELNSEGLHVSYVYYTLRELPKNRYTYFHTFNANFRDPGSLPSDEDLQTAQISPDVIIDDVCKLAPPGGCRGKMIERPQWENFRRGATTS